MLIRVSLPNGRNPHRLKGIAGRRSSVVNRRTPRINLGAIVLALCLLALALPATAGAQSGASAVDIVVLQTVVSEVDGQLTLRTYFVLRDRNGQPIIANDPREATFELDGIVTPTTVGPPQEPIKIALVIDASGSMNDARGGTPLIDEVRAAAERMIDIAPQNAEFVVFSFAEWVERQHEGFLRKRDQAELIKDAIRGFTINPSGHGNTCLYDAASQAIDALIAAEPAPTERLSVILFTDGKDRQGQGDGCSNLGAPEVIRKALNAASAPIPIYTIGVCMGEPGAESHCDNINQDELIGLAEKTRAFPVIGPRGGLDGLFSRLMEGLSSQWVAETTLCTDAGRQVALLSVELEDGQVSEDIPFEASQTCLPPTSVEVRSQIYAPETDTYTVTLNIVSPQRIAEMTVGVYAYAEGGSLVAPALSFQQPGEQLVFTLPSDGMVSGSEYFLRVTAVDSTGQPVRNEEGSTILANSRFPYQPRLSFVILGVDPNWTDEQLVVNVRTLGVGARAVQFSGELRVPETGESETLPAMIYQGGRLSFPMPRILREATEAQEYELVLETSVNGEPLRQSYKRRIEPLPASPPPLTNWLLLSLGTLLLAGAGATIFLLRRPQPAVKIVAPPPGSTVLHPTARPTPADATELVGPEATRLARQLRLRVVTTPSPGPALERTISCFPFVIGRNTGGLTLPHDSKVSGEHLKIEEAPGGFKLTDLNSSNGTWVSERRLAKGESLAFDEPVVVRLGPDTTIELQPT